MQIDPTQPQDDKAQKFFIACAIDPATKRPYPICVDPATGLLKVSASFGDITVDIDIPDKIETFGKVTISGSQQALPNVALKAGVTIKAADGNTGIVWVGDTGVAADSGLPLAAGESIFIPIENASKVYLLGDTSGDKLYYLGG